LGLEFPGRLQKSGRVGPMIAWVLITLIVWGAIIGGKDQ